MQSKQVESLRQQNARLWKAIKDKLGSGVWGLDKKDNFTHEEIVFLFARVYPAFGIDYIKEVRSSYPDCICIKNGEEIAIEFEPVLSSFRDHIQKDDLGKCQYIVCWQDDLESYSPIKEEIQKHDINIIKLKDFYEEGKVKDRSKSLDWSLKDMQRLTENQIKLLYAFIANDKDILTSKEISKFIGVKGKALGGVIGGFKTTKEWLIRKHPRGWQFNKKYKHKIIKIVSEFGPDIGIR